MFINTGDENLNINQQDFPFAFNNNVSLRCPPCVAILQCIPHCVYGWRCAFTVVIPTRMVLPNKTWCNSTIRWAFYFKFESLREKIDKLKLIFLMCGYCLLINLVVFFLIYWPLESVRLLSGSCWSSKTNIGIFAIFTVWNLMPFILENNLPFLT